MHAPLSLQGRLRLAMTNANISAAKLATLTNTTPAGVSKWLKTGYISKSNLILCAQLLDTSVDWLLVGGPSDTTYALNKVPVLTWSGAVCHHLNIANNENNEVPNIGLLHCNTPHSLLTYALRISGDAMQAPAGKSYMNGCLIFIDPKQRELVTSGDRVVALTKNLDQAIFRELIDDGLQIFLKPLNIQYPTVHGNFVVIGKVIGKWEDE